MEEVLKNLPAHICALIGFIFLIISTQEKNKNKILIYQSLFYLFFFLQYILIGVYSASILCIVSLIRNIIYYFKTNKLSYFIIILVLIIGTITGIYDVNNYGLIIPFLPLVINLIYTYVLSKNNIKFIKKGFLICSIIWIIYNYFIGAYIGLICNILEMFSYILYFKRLKK